MFNGIAVYIMLCMLFLWLGSTWRKRLVGFGFFTDLSVHILLQFLLGGDGQGRLAVLFGCVMFNLTLLAYRKFRGYYTPSTDGWIFHPGWTTSKKFAHENESSVRSSTREASVLASK